MRNWRCLLWWWDDGAGSLSELGKMRGLVADWRGGGLRNAGDGGLGLVVSLENTLVWVMEMVQEYITTYFQTHGRRTEEYTIQLRNTEREKQTGC